MKNKKKMLMDIVFLLIFIVLLIFLGLGSIFNGETISLYENRPAVQYELPTISNYLKGDFQNQFEDALSDQIVHSTTMKKKYNLGVSKIKHKLNQRFYSQEN